MIEKEAFRQILNYVLVVILFVIAFIIVKPVFFAIIYGILLAYIFYPVYTFLLRKIKNETVSAFLVCFTTSLVLIVFLFVTLGALLKQVINFYLKLQDINIGEIIVKALPNSIITPDISATIISTVNSSVSKLLARFASSLGDFVINIPSLSLQLFVLIFVFFFALRDGEKAFEYFKSLSPLKKETQNKFFAHFENITKSVIIGEIVVGVVQGIIAGVGFYIFGVPNALLLTLLTVALSILPIIGPWLIWIPVDVYLFVSGNEGAGLGLLIYGLFLINSVDNILRPMIISRRTQINHAIVLIGMVGGLYVFGIIGLIIGPLILAYVLLVLELYRKQGLEDNVIFKQVEG
ncbi:AI-2E family transporter [Candidatus Pacearchaeota archaeon]|nr:AI-2E family transporter [Candidatus Pacearchaeota archaeon]